MWNAFLTRWARSRAASPSRGQHNSIASRQSTLPPTRSGAASSRISLSGNDSIWQSLLRWIPGDSDPWGASQPPSPAASQNLASARAEFQACMAGLYSPPAASGAEPGTPPQVDSVRELQRSIRRARSLRDLWHLRTWLYTEVARQFSQHEAEQRLQRLDALFQGGSSQPLNAKQQRLLAQTQARVQAKLQAQAHAETLARMRQARSAQKDSKAQSAQALSADTLVATLSEPCTAH
ncbi:hypothetical protein C1O66_05325 [Paucibacter aquatile]|uniref:Uncharacterized protein n=1 Tax=Kinneretia aquatilis TaxID=2070761 RepID=A0A2N8KU79_9BURK|nr:hypothetical protein [Paucibacter aquatile]PND37011.1 hypothetical protein C1O66_05325 [Paucibacter aquatile]